MPILRIIFFVLSFFFGFLSLLLRPTSGRKKLFYAILWREEFEILFLSHAKFDAMPGHYPATDFILVIILLQRLDI